MTYNIGGKEVRVKKGTNPYTNSVNSDAKNGVMPNGYQPDNVASYFDGDVEKGKLTDSGEEAEVNGQWVPIYTTSDGQRWVYDAANNEYFHPEEEKEEKGKNYGGMGVPGGPKTTQLLKQ